MKLEIYNAAKEAEQPVRLALKQQDDRVVVAAVDKNGVTLPGGNLVTFYNDGRMRRVRCVADYIGFQLDSDHCVKEIDGYG